MNRGISIHVGLNAPRINSPGDRLRRSEETAWAMAGLAHRAGYRSILTLIGREARRGALTDALSAAARTLGKGDTLFLSFSGHGARVKDLSGDEGSYGWDEAWCLDDGNLLDDELGVLWTKFAAGVRILVVSESCYSGGAARDDETMRKRLPHPDPCVATGEDGKRVAQCITPPRNRHDIGASLLLLASSGFDKKSEDGLYSGYLFDLWDDGAYAGSYCELHRALQAAVRDGGGKQEPQIAMLGEWNAEFPLATAFHLDGRGGYEQDVMRDGSGLGVPPGEVMRDGGSGVSRGGVTRGGGSGVSRGGETRDGGPDSSRSGGMRGGPDPGVTRGGGYRGEA